MVWKLVGALTTNGLRDCRKLREGRHRPSVLFPHLASLATKPYIELESEDEDEGLDVLEKDLMERQRDIRSLVSDTNSLVSDTNSLVPDTSSLVPDTSSLIPLCHSADVFVWLQLLN
uniref:Uncharacterized protein n=1 Tax=Timema bartmani TaxID=61472 RepID=A0A7R9I6C8_9NEOP|nr:unnamed protein product [Timema bartmani]